MTARIVLAILVILAIGAPLQAQSGPGSPRGWTISLSAGGTAFTDFQRSSTLEPGRLQSGTVQETEFSRRIGAETAVVLAGTLAYWPGRNWGIRIGGSYTPTRFEAIHSQSSVSRLGSADSAGMARLGIYTYDAQALFRMPTIRNRVMPYGFVGAGMMRFVASHQGGEIPAEAAASFSEGPATQAAATVGLGGRLGTRRQGWSLHFEIADRISRTPLHGETAGPVRWLNTVGFTVGIGLAL